MERNSILEKREVEGPFVWRSQSQRRMRQSSLVGIAGAMRQRLKKKVSNGDWGIW